METTTEKPRPEAILEYYGEKIYSLKQAIRALKREQEAALPRRYTTGEEICSAIIHGTGACLAVAALVLLALRAAVWAPAEEKAFYITGFVIFGAAMFVLYLMSTLYHALTPYRVKRVFAVFDHCSIYLLIAGTYTALCLSVLRGNLGWALFAISWGFAAAGITLYAVFGSKLRLLSVFTYVPMGWLIVFAGGRAFKAIPGDSLKFLLLGGVLYTIGIIFYAMKKVRWTHCIWHAFALSGSIMHFFSVMRLV